jgi:mannan endo-1,4-beta-mannosidase
LQQVLDSTNNWFNQVETEFVRRSLQRQRNNRRGTIGLVVIGFALVWLFAGCQGSQNQQTQIDPIKNDKVKVLKGEIRDYKVLKYLKSISNRQTVAGQHNKYLSTPDKSTEEISKIISENSPEKISPGLWSSDFLFGPGDLANRDKMIKVAKEQWNKGAIINLMYHACPPKPESEPKGESEPCGNKLEDAVKSNLTESQWKDLITDGGTLNKEWKLRLDKVAVFLQQLKEEGVEVLWRPLHEMNQGKFWWGGRPEYSPKLYQITHDYLVKGKGLTNLIWVWSLQDFENLEQDLKAYDPGDSYWDIAALDIYSKDDQGYYYKEEKYNDMRNYAKGKPIAIGECFKLPDVEILKKQPLWTFFMGWDECVYCQNKDECPDDCSVNNSKEEIRKLYNDPKILTLKELPGWGP